MLTSTGQPPLSPVRTSDQGQTEQAISGGRSAGDPTGGGVGDMEPAGRESDTEAAYWLREGWVRSRHGWFKVFPVVR